MCPRLVAVNLRQPGVDRWIADDESVDVCELEEATDLMHRRIHRRSRQAAVAKLSDVQLDVRSLDSNERVGACWSRTSRTTAGAETRVAPGGGRFSVRLVMSGRNNRRGRRPQPVEPRTSCRDGTGADLAGHDVVTWRTRLSLIMVRRTHGEALPPDGKPGCCKVAAEWASSPRADRFSMARGP